jgi:transposase
MKEGALMAKRLVSDDLWELAEPLLPAPKPRRFRYRGRKPMDRRKVLTGILFVLKSGTPWEMGCGSGMTCWRYLKTWQEQGVWQKIHEALLARLQEADAIDWSRAAVDSAFVRALLGELRRVPTPPTGTNPAASTI